MRVLAYVLITILVGCGSLGCESKSSHAHTEGHRLTIKGSDTMVILNHRHHWTLRLRQIDFAAHIQSHE